MAKNTWETVVEARRPYHEAVERLANQMGVPFVDTDTTSTEDAPDGGIGVMFNGLGRASIVRYEKGDYMNLAYGMGGVDEVRDMCRFAAECFRYSKVAR